MIKITHRIFLTVLLLVNVFATSFFSYIYSHIILTQAEPLTKYYINASFGLFIFMLWLLFVVILFYAKNNGEVSDLTP